MALRELLSQTGNLFFQLRYSLVGVVSIFLGSRPGLLAMAAVGAV